MTSLRCFGLVIVSALAPTLLTSPAHAAPSTCDVTAGGARSCVDVITCAGDDVCFIGEGTEDWYCSSSSSVRPDSRECVAACTTMFGCDLTVDCPGGPPGTFALCQPASSAPGVCTYRGTAPANQRITYCSAAGSPVLDHFLGACHTRPGGAGYTPDYYQGDCDGDGCPNGADDNPCAMPTLGASCGITGPAAVSRFCPPVPALACAVAAAGGLACANARPCSTDGLPCEGPATCEDGWSDVPRCRPECSSFFLCDTRRDGGLGGCPPFDGQDGACVPLPTVLVDYPQHDGICVYASFADSSCGPSSVSPSCFVDPGSMNLTTDFFRGDCDGDGVANGCDSMRCAIGSEAVECVTVPGIGCGAMLPPLDAGVADGGGGNIDGGEILVPDAAVDTDGGGGDAGTRGDSGNASFDAGASAVGTSRVSFSGGGGCRCSAAGTDHGGRYGITLALVALALIVKRRSRRG